MGPLKVVDASTLIDRDGIRYEPGSVTPFTGVAVVYWPSGKKKMEAEFRGGKEDGKFTLWDESGKKRTEGMFRNGREVTSLEGDGRRE